MYFIFSFILLHLGLLELLNELIFQKGFVLLQDVVVVSLDLEVVLAVVVFSGVLKALAFFIESVPCWILFGAAKNVRPVDSGIIPRILVVNLQILTLDLLFSFTLLTAHYHILT